MNKILSKRNVYYIIVIIIITILGFGSKHYHGIYEHIINNKIAGLWYVVFWTLLIRFFSPRIPLYLLSGIVLMTTIALEFTQLLSFEFMQTLRNFYVIRAIIGSHFSWSDLPFYFGGSIVSVLLIITIEKKRK